MAAARSMAMDHALPDALFTVPGGNADGAIVVALSGGLDSSVLLHRLAELPAIGRRGLRALHVHHGLHADADAWSAHCASMCSTLGIPLDVRRVRVARDSGLGPEAAARAARREAFADALASGEVLALAHHLDDQAETFLLRALRASGPEGLAAMRPWRRFGSGWMWRPLLAIPRAQLEAWARSRGLAWIEDPANADPAHDRSILRHKVMPLLRTRWAGADVAFARSATLCADAADLLAAHDAEALDALLAGSPAPADDDAGIPTGQGVAPLPIPPLRALPPAGRARLLRAWAMRLGLPPLPAAAIPAIERLLEARDDARAEYRWSGAVLRSWRGRLHGMPLPAAIPVGWSLDWDGRTPLALPGGGRLALEGTPGFDHPLRVHDRRGGERMHLPGRSHSHALKHLLQDAAIPPWLRMRMPLLSDPGGRLLAAGDTLLSASFHAWLQDRGARLRWQDLA